MDRRLSTHAVSELIGLIYDCAIDPQRWPAALQALRVALDFHNATLALQALPAATPLLSATSGIEREWLERIPQYSADYIERWGGREQVERLPFEEPAVLSWVNPRRNWECTRYYTEWARPQGIIDILAIGVARDARSIGSIILGRHQDAGDITTDDVAAARLFVPHLQRAVAISRVLDLQTLAVATLEAVLDTLAAAVMLVNAQLHVIHANRAARMMLSGGDLIGSRNGVLRLCSAGATAALSVAVAQAAQDEYTMGRRGLGVPLQGAAGQCCVLHVLPLCVGPLPRGLMPSAVAAIFVAPVAARPSSQMAALTTLFELTAAETAVLETVASGRSVAETAEALHVSIATVKTHLQHIYDKTGVRRQADLVGLVSSFALPLES